MMSTRHFRAVPVCQHPRLSTGQRRLMNRLIDWSSDLDRFYKVDPRFRPRVNRLASAYRAELLDRLEMALEEIIEPAGVALDGGRRTPTLSGSLPAPNSALNEAGSAPPLPHGAAPPRGPQMALGVNDDGCRSDRALRVLWVFAALLPLAAAYWREAYGW